MRVLEIIPLVGTFLFVVLFCTASNQKAAAALAQLVSDAFAAGLCWRGSNFFSWVLLFTCAILPVKIATNGKRARLGFAVARPLAHTQLVSNTLGLAVCFHGFIFLLATLV